MRAGWGHHHRRVHLRPPAEKQRPLSGVLDIRDSTDNFTDFSRESMTISDSEISESTSELSFRMAT